MKRQDYDSTRNAASAAFVLICFAMLSISVCPDAGGASSGTVVQWASYGLTVPPPNTVQRGVIAIAAGLSHSMALKEDGSVVVWGSTQYGLTNVPVAARSGVKAIAAGLQHSLALRIDGIVVGWGIQQLRPGNTANRTQQRHRYCSRSGS